MKAGYQPARPLIRRFALESPLPRERERVARQRFSALDAKKRADLLEFLKSL